VVVKVFFNGVQGWVVFHAEVVRADVPFAASACAAPVIGVGMSDGGVSGRGGAQHYGRSEQQCAADFSKSANRSTVGFSHGDPCLSAR
jgi:hypothetical protein